MEKATVQSIDRALTILEALSTQREGLGVTDLSQRIGLHKSTTHRLLVALLERGYVEQAHDGHYRIGLRLVDLCSLYLNHVELKTEAAPYLRALVEYTTLPVHLAVLDGMEVVYIDKVETLSSIRMYSQIGRRAPAHATGVGKAMLMDTPERELLSRLNAANLTAYTKRTITEPKRFVREIRECRQRGWTKDDQEHEEGITCIAAPIYDYRGSIIAAVSTTGLSRSFTERAESDIAQRVVDAARRISERMGYVGKAAR